MHCPDAEPPIINLEELKVNKTGGMIYQPKIITREKVDFPKMPKQTVESIRALFYRMARECFFYLNRISLLLFL